MNKRYISLFLILFFLSVLVVKIIVDNPQNSVNKQQVDQCMSCHSTMNDIDHSHPKEIFGCFKCHGGNAYATNKTDAHKGMVLNPSRLEHAVVFCSECHSDIIKRVSSSLMQTQSGILNVLKYQWGESSDLNSIKGVDDIRGIIDSNSLAENHFRKACAACHVNQDEDIFDNPKTARGGGCSDCHRATKGNKNQHPTYSTKIPKENCLKCHNRSNRIGLSYIGIFESEGYGTPYKNGEFSNMLEDGRAYYNLPADIHHKIAKLECIDCHTEAGVMGDGKRYHHMEEAVDISCEDCHKPSFDKANDLAITLSDLNKDIPEPKTIAYTKKKNSPLYQLQQDINVTSFYRKMDGKRFDMSFMSEKPYHSLDIHKRLDCSSCHSSWMPSCYGCHEVYFENGKQYDWVEKRATKGEWQEYRSFLRWEKPSLGIGYNGKVMPFAPGCQVIGTVFKDKNIEQFHAMAMAGWDPHTTQKQSRECVDCHFDPASLGIGRGIFDLKGDKVSFIPYYNSIKSKQPFSYPIDSFCSIDGEQFQTTSRKNSRSFNKNELEKIVNAYRCIICHDSYDDKIYKNFEKSKELFYSGVTKCLD